MSRLVILLIVTVFVEYSLGEKSCPPLVKFRKGCNVCICSPNGFDYTCTQNKCHPTKRSDNLEMLLSDEDYYKDDMSNDINSESTSDSAEMDDFDSEEDISDSDEITDDKEVRFRDNNELDSDDLSDDDDDDFDSDSFYENFDSEDDDHYVGKRKPAPWRKHKQFP
ncbi:unnamed protein product [Diabrotica balteata]|uniref:Pacifastin domain-containing protein n=1 Tax=Diabrotica balteata TaxID=107213 RepID=A0A9N9T2R9_DIABA|nr:unnamed protein product [Diabrotica balteata]